jgi:hypothetical protein
MEGKQAKKSRDHGNHCVASSRDFFRNHARSCCGQDQKDPVSKKSSKEDVLIKPRRLKPYLVRVIDMGLPHQVGKYPADLPQHERRLRRMQVER